MPFSYSTLMDMYNLVDGFRITTENISEDFIKFVFLLGLRFVILFDFINKPRSNYTIFPVFPIYWLFYETLTLVRSVAALL